MSLDWSGWTIVSDSFRTTPGAPVTAVPWGTRFALFATNPDGVVYATAGNTQEGWPDWKSVSDGQTTRGAPITAVPWGAGFAVFITYPNGVVLTTGGTPGYPFGGWATVSDGQTMPGAPVTAVPWGAGFAVFISDPSGGVYTTGGNPNAPFGPWAPVVPPGESEPFLASPGGPVTALIPTIGAPFTVFTTKPTTDETRSMVWCTIGDPQRGFPGGRDEDKGWSRVAYIWGEIVLEPGSLVTADWQVDSYVVYVTARSGPGGLAPNDDSVGIFTTLGTPERGWQRWSRVPGINVLPASPITKVGPFLFVTDAKGEVFTNADAGPQGWEPVSEGSSVPGARVTACVAGSPIPTITLFIADPNGGVYTTSAPWP